MKILQLVTRRQYRGAEVFAATLSSELLHQNHQIIFAGLYAPPGKDLNVGGALNVDLTQNGSTPSFIHVLSRLIVLINRERPDVIQANGSDTLKFAVASRIRTPRIPIVYRNISIISSWIRSSMLKKAFYRFLFQRTDHISSVGYNSRQDLISLFNLPEQKVSVIRRGIPIKREDKTAARELMMKKFLLQATDKIVVHVGNFSAEKNQKFLVQVFDELRNHHDIKLIMVGDGPLFEKIQMQVKSAQLQERIFFAGFNANPEVFLASSDLAVLCSYVEGVPGVVLEAAAQKVPVLAINVGGVSEVIVHEQTGVLVPNHDVPLFAYHLVKILEDQETRNKYGERAYELVRSEFDPTQNANAFLELYTSLIK